MNLVFSYNLQLIQLRTAAYSSKLILSPTSSQLTGRRLPLRPGP